MNTAWMKFKRFFHMSVLVALLLLVYWQVKGIVSIYFLSDGFVDGMEEDIMRLVSWSRTMGLDELKARILTEFDAPMVDDWSPEGEPGPYRAEDMKLFISDFAAITRGHIRNEKVVGRIEGYDLPTLMGTYGGWMSVRYGKDGGILDMTIYYDRALPIYEIVSE